MSQAEAPQTTFASGRYSKRKRTQVNYRMEELDVDETDFESEEDITKPKKQRKTAASKPLSRRTIFPFLELPAEIRNMIYSYALTDSSGINFVAVQRNKRRCVERVSRDTIGTVSRARSPYQSSKINDGNALPASLVPSLLAVNKQIHRESRDILYSNELVFADTIALYSFMINLGPTSAKHLKKMRLMAWNNGRTSRTYNNACFATMVYATNLEKFYIDTSIGCYGSPKHAAQQVYRNAFPWLEAIGRAKGKYDAAIDVLDVHNAVLGRFYHRGSQASQDALDAFNAELSRNLGLQQKRIMAKSVKRRTVSKDGQYAVSNAQASRFSAFAVPPSPVVSSPVVSTWSSPMSKLTSWLFNL